MNTQKLALVLAIGTLLAVILNGVASYSAFQTTEALAGRGRVSSVNVDVFSDAACTIRLTEINWGLVDPGVVYNYSSVYVKNTGTKTLVLSMSALNLPSWLTLTWNRESAVITKDAVSQAIISLSVNASAPMGTEFAFDIIITGTAT